jgi:hypothetical protein
MFSTVVYKNNLYQTMTPCRVVDRPQEAGG